MIINFFVLALGLYLSYCIRAVDPKYKEVYIYIYIYILKNDFKYIINEIN